MFAGNFAPRGFMLCQGQTLPIQQYAALFSILGTTYGGNGTTTFNLPDLRGRAPIGQGQGLGLSMITLGESAGVENASILAANMPAHNHLINVSTSNGNQKLAQNNFLATANDGNRQANQYPAYETAATTGATLAAGAVTSAGGSTPVAIRNPFLGINYIIAVQGIFPSRN
jgi:microcystin-dependent protein